MEIDAASFDVFFASCFHGGLVPRRELRLTQEQAERIRCQCPAATVTPMEPCGWYLVCFPVMADG